MTITNCTLFICSDHWKFIFLTGCAWRSWLKIGFSKSQRRNYPLVLRRFLIVIGLRFITTHPSIFGSWQKRLWIIFHLAFFSGKLLKISKTYIWEVKKQKKWKSRIEIKIQFKMQFHNEFGTSKIKKLVYHMNSRVRFFLLRFT
jgi:hypothetical protein